VQLVLFMKHMLEQENKQTMLESLTGLEQLSSALRI